MQQRREQLLREGKLSPGLRLGDDEKDGDNELKKSESTYQVLPEVLQAQTRIDEPNAARRKEYELRHLKGRASPPTEEELRRYKLQNVAAFSIPRLSLGGRNRYNPLPSTGVDKNSSYVPAKPLPPEVAEAAKRTFLVGLRALTYGSLIGLGLLAFGTTFVVQNSQRFQNDFRESVHSAVQPFSQSIRQSLHPWRVWVQEKFGVINKTEK